MNCRVCRTGRAVPAWRFELTGRTALVDYLRSALNRDRVQISILRCDDCASLFQYPTFESEVYWGWYQSRDYQFERGIGYAPSPHESIRYAKQMVDNTIGSLGKAQGRVLDVGCGRGFYLAMCGESGWDVQGCEISPIYSEHASRIMGLPVWQKPYEESDQSEATFDLITFWDIFEHFSNPGAVLESTRALLRDDGIIALEVPHARGLYARLLGRKWWFGFEHIFYYSVKGLVRLLMDHGFEPMFIATDNVNLVSREGLSRLRLFGEDGVWGRHKDDSSLRRYMERSSRGKHSRPWKNPSYRFYDLCPLAKTINSPLNRFLNGVYLGDQLRIFASKRCIS